MQKIKNSQWFIVALVLTMLVSFSVALADEQAQNRNKVQQQNNQLQRNQEENGSNDNSSDNSNEINGEAHRSAVSTFAQKILDVADRDGGIGEDVKSVAIDQNESKDKVADAIDKIKNRNTLKTFLIGTDYKNIGELRSEIAKTDNQINQLNNLLEKATTEENKTALQAQITALEQEQQKIENFVKTNESKFSLFGWFVKLFNQ